jgi:hypothetical protein
MLVTVTLKISAKEDNDGLSPPLPFAEEIRERLNDVLQDITKHDETLSWRVDRVDLGTIDWR